MSYFHKTETAPVRIAKRGGFTLIETMISISLFLIIVTMGMNALLNASLVHQKSQDMASIIDSITFMTEDMSRSIRTGYNYHCGDPGSVQTPLIETPKSCVLGGNIFFENGTNGVPGAPSDQWGYNIVSTDGGVTYNINRTTDGGATWVQLNPPGVVLKSFSGFSVLGAEPPSSGDKQQPLVVIKLVGTITYKGTVSPFSIQTTVSQRLLDR